MEFGPSTNKLVESNGSNGANETMSAKKARRANHRIVGDEPMIVNEENEPAVEIKWMN